MLSVCCYVVVLSVLRDLLNTSNCRTLTLSSWTFSGKLNYTAAIKSAINVYWLVYYWIVSLVRIKMEATIRIRIFYRFYDIYCVIYETIEIWNSAKDSEKFGNLWFFKQTTFVGIDTMNLLIYFSFTNHFQVLECGVVVGVVGWGRLTVGVGLSVPAWEISSSRTRAKTISHHCRI